MKGIIYRYFNKLTNQNYIGQTTDEQGRRNAHECCIGTNLFHKAIIQYGLINFEYSIIEQIEEENERDLFNRLNEREIYWIDYYDSFNNGYNQTKGGSPSYTNAIKNKLWREDKKKEGLYVGGYKMTGYKINQNQEYIIDEEKANIVRKIYDMCANKYISIKLIAKELNISTKTIHSILHRKDYYGGVKGKPAIISKELYDKANYNLKNKLNIQTYKQSHLLNKKLFTMNNIMLKPNSTMKYFCADGISISYRCCDLLVGTLKDIEYNKIKIEKPNRTTIITHIYNNEEHIKDMVIDSYHVRIAV